MAGFEKRPFGCQIVKKDGSLFNMDRVMTREILQKQKIEKKEFAEHSFSCEFGAFEFKGILSCILVIG